MSRCNACHGICTKVCGNCKSAFYCDRTCQISDWVNHKRECEEQRTEKEIKEKGFTYRQYAHYRIREAERKATNKGLCPIEVRNHEKEKLINQGFKWSAEDEYEYHAKSVLLVGRPSYLCILSPQAKLHESFQIIPSTSDFLDSKLRGRQSLPDFLDYSLKWKANLVNSAPISK